MTQKKYQVFISSTFEDLLAERAEIAKGVLDLDHIPAGMETFLSVDTDQFSYIQRVIDQCDYYVLIIAGLYGSVDSDGVSFTEKEYDYAVSKGKVVLASIHQDPGKLPSEKAEKDSSRMNLLENFKAKVKKGRLVSFWNDKNELALKIIKSLSRAIIEHPQIGWVRGDTVGSEALLRQLNEVRNENEKLKAAAGPPTNTFKLPTKLADLSETFELSYSFYIGYSQYKHKTKLTWQAIFEIAAPSAISAMKDSDLNTNLSIYIQERIEPEGRDFSIYGTDIDTIKIQLLATGYFQLINDNLSSLKLTREGLQFLIESRSVKTNSAV